ncbi:hypothetical protein L1987_34248 [Smallanthus sonchifolius]|uniref:Uncharacterized protein n=1 Tax=Smallanthus sonchifolius TaxID=185202 RepID=A0ACB9HUI8_9ASTR|nr:hypothetical protein L1987_34248 [Smallanthus sonchifolius]
MEIFCSRISRHGRKSTISDFYDRCSSSLLQNRSPPLSLPAHIAALPVSSPPFAAAAVRRPPPVSPALLAAAPLTSQVLNTARQTPPAVRPVPLCSANRLHIIGKQFLISCLLGKVFQVRVNFEKDEKKAEAMWVVGLSCNSSSRFMDYL